MKLFFQCGISFKILVFQNKGIISSCSVFFAALILFSCTSIPVKDSVKNQSDIVIFPDYKNITIPVNIAPLNFTIFDQYSAHFVIAECRNEKLTAKNKGTQVFFPKRKWTKLLKNSVNDTISVTIFCRTNNRWERFNSFYWYISGDSIDPYLTYRLIDPGYAKWGSLGIYMRNISSFDQFSIFKNSFSDNNCMNCHCFNAGNANEFMFHLRGKHGGTIINTSNGLNFLNTKTQNTLSAGVYPSWHPSGNYIAMSSNDINQIFRNGPHETIEVFDIASDIVLLDIKKKQITTTPKICTKQRENLPCWDPLGEYLYFIRSAPFNDTVSITEFRYDLFRIKFEENGITWGDIDTIFMASKIGKSVSFPKVSPCGRFILFTLSGYGYFTIHHSDADLYMFDLKENRYFQLTMANSNQAESYHSWSSNGRWIVFSSKRLDGVCGRPFFCHIDSSGIASKAFVMPQKNPDSYKLITQSYNIPEFSTGKVTISKRKIRKSIYKKPEDTQFDKTVETDALSGATSLNAKENGNSYLEQ